MQAAEVDLGVSSADLRLLRDEIRRCLQAEGVDTDDLSLVQLDLDARGNFQPFAGAMEVRWCLLQRRTSHVPMKGTLILGLRPAGSLSSCSVVGARALLDLLSWPGAIYLEFGFDLGRLILGARAVIGGARAPLPAALKWTAEDVKTIASEVRHWAQNRDGSLGGALMDFRRAADGGPALHSSYFEPVVCLSDEHRQMLDRLIACECDVAWMLRPDAVGQSCASAVSELEAAWLTLEAARAACRNVDEAGDGGALSREMSQMVEALRSARGTLKALVAATRALERRTGQRDGA